MLRTKRLLFALIATLLLVLSACNTSVESPEPKPIEDVALDNCDKLLDISGEFVRNGARYQTDEQGRPYFMGVANFLGDQPQRPGRRFNCQQTVGNLYGEGTPEERAMYEGGHLLGAQLGGWGKRANMVPQIASFNKGNWAQMENKAALCKRNDEVYMAVSVEYPDDDTIIPDVFSIYFAKDGGDADDTVSGNETIERTFNNVEGGGAGATQKRNEIIAWLGARGCN